MTRARRPNISSQESQRVAFRLEVVDSTSGALCFLGNLPSEGCVPFPLQGRQLGFGLAHRRRIKGIKGTRSRGSGPRRVQLIFRLLVVLRRDIGRNFAVLVVSALVVV